MKSAIVYYSLSGKTKRLAKDIAEQLKCEIIEISEEKSRKGFIGFMKSGYQAATKKTPKIKTNQSIEKFDMIILATPVWAGTMSSPMRSFITENKGILADKKVAFVSTHGAKDPQRTFVDMQELIGKKPTAAESSSGQFNMKKFISACQPDKSLKD